MKVEDYINKIEDAWDEGGFLYNLRSGVFTKEDGAAFLQLIGDLDLAEYDLIPKRLLSLMWFLPSFLEWQRERVSEVNKDLGSEYPRFIDEAHNILQKTLGVP